MKHRKTTQRYASLPISVERIQQALDEDRKHQTKRKGVVPIADQQEGRASDRKAEKAEKQNRRCEHTDGSQNQHNNSNS